MPSEVFMIPISSAISGGLVWSKIPHQRGYELKSNGSTIAALQRKSCWSQEFRAESQQRSWKFRRIGFWRFASEIVDVNSGVQIATFKPNWGGGGRLVFSDGQTFQSTSKGLWRPVWSVLACSPVLAHGQLVLSLQARGRKVVSVNQMHLPEDRLTLLAIFTWHIMQQTAEDAAAGAAAD
jgi:hypothetical protein